METLLEFPPGKSRQIVRSVRRDPKFAPQLYSITKEMKGQNLLVSLEQAIWDKTSNQTTSYVFFKHKVEPSYKMHYAIDERDKIIHVIYDRDREVRSGRLGLAFGKPDKLGYRRASVPPTKYQLAFGDGNVVTFEDAERFDITLAAVNIFPSTAELILHCKCAGEKHIGFFPRRVNNTAPQALPLLSELQSQEMEARSHVFSRCNHVLTLVSYHTRCPFASVPDLRNMMRKRMPWADGFTILYSHDAKMQPINTLQIDPVQLLQSFLPKSLLDGLKADAPADMPDFMFFGAHLELLGHLHKYVIFFFHHHYVLAAKWQKNWYKMQQVPRMHQMKVILVDKQKKYGDIRDVWLGSNDLCFKVELHGAETIRRMSLGHKFKDYRTCAFCGKEEKGKTKNKLAKRVSSFKVCRLCKELNLHKRYADARVMGCHYCSFECVQKDWKQHKKVHSGAAK